MSRVISVLLRYHNVVWLEDLKVPVTVALSMLDDIVPSEAIFNHFKWHYGEPDEHGRFKDPPASRQRGGVPLPDARVLAWKGLGHGGMLISKQAQDQLILAMTSQAREQGLLKWVGRKSV